MKAIGLTSILILLSSCSDTGIITSATSEKNLLSNGRDQPNDGQSENSDTAVNEPVMIGGSFLVCADDSQLADQASSEGSFGCRIELANGNKADTFTPVNEDIIAEGESIRIQGQANGNADSFWHWTFSYNPEQRHLIVVKLVNPQISTLNRETEIQDFHPERRRQDLTQTDGFDDSGDGPAPIPVLELSEHRIFVTNLAYRPGGNQAQQFNSVLMADSICTQRAMTANLDGSYRAIMSDSAISARERIAITAQVLTVDDRLISNPNLFWTDDHLRNIDRDEFGNQVDLDEIGIWTGSNEKGITMDMGTCSNWTDSSALGIGHIGLGDSEKQWLSSRGETCDQSLRLMCISQ